jgi:zinc-ribbon domain
VEEFSVLVEARAPEGAPGLDDATADQAAAALVEALAGHYVSGGVGGRAWTARVTLAADSPALAVGEASVRVGGAALDAGLPEWPFVRIEAVRGDVLAEDLERPQLPELVSAPEAAEILGVSPQRVHVLARENSRFPKPILTLQTGKIWLRAAIIKFAETWERKPGRPKKEKPTRACPECGADLRPGVAFCPACGVEVDD